MNDDRTASFLKGIKPKDDKPKLANMNLRVDPDLKYLMDLAATHKRENLVDTASRAMWIYLAATLDRRLIVDKALLERLCAYDMERYDVETPAPEPARGPASLKDRLLTED